VATPPLDSPCDGPVTYPGDTKILVKSSKGKSGPTLNTTTRLGLTDKESGYNMYRGWTQIVATTCTEDGHK